jgi:hypothetical protein
LRVRVICLMPFSTIFPLYRPLDNKYMYLWVLYRMESCWLTLEIGFFLSKITNTIDIYTTLFVFVFIIVHPIFHLIVKVLQHKRFFSSRLSNNNFFLNCLLNIKLLHLTILCSFLAENDNYQFYSLWFDLTEGQTQSTALKAITPTITPPIQVSHFMCQCLRVNMLKCWMFIYISFYLNKLFYTSILIRKPYFNYNF